MQHENLKHENVQAYYGETLQSSADLQTNACCTPDAMPGHVKQVLAKLHDEVLSRYYGCGLIAPPDLAGMHILDLGCGAGRDVYALSALVGASGRVVGVDMTPAQLDVARAHRDFHAKAFGHAHSNVEFQHGYIETLAALDLQPGSFDIIVSNCVINLATDKQAVLHGAYDLLKPGGEMYFSDVYADRRVPAALAEDEVLYGECLSGALYWNDFLTFARDAGFADPRLVTSRALAVQNPELEARLSPLKFVSATYRLFRLEGLEAGHEDYGQSVIYKGTVAHAPDVIEIDADHAFATGRAVAVSGNSWRMLQQSRFARHFAFIGDFDTHMGAFSAGAGGSPFRAASLGGGCCG
jgi:arsenite methyltransferase